jgi:hypothetical protein
MKSQVAYLKLLKTNGAILLNQKLNSKNRLITEDANAPKEVGLRNFFTLRVVPV